MSIKTEVRLSMFIELNKAKWFTRSIWLQFGTHQTLVHVYPVHKRESSLSGCKTGRSVPCYMNCQNGKLKFKGSRVRINKNQNIRPYNTYIILYM